MNYVEYRYFVSIQVSGGGSPQRAGYGASKLIDYMIQLSLMV